jgi:hypothetical protein
VATPGNARRSTLGWKAPSMSPATGPSGHTHPVPAHPHTRHGDAHTHIKHGARPTPTPTLT